MTAPEPATVYVARYFSNIKVYTSRQAAQDWCLNQVKTTIKANPDAHPAGTFRWLEHPENRGDIDNLFIDPIGCKFPGDMVAHHTRAQVWRMPVQVAE